MIRIFIADDHVLLRDGLKRILSEDSRMVIVGEASRGRDTLKALRQQPWDVLILDVSMPDLGGLEVLTRLRAQDTQGKVLILTQHDDSQLAKRFLMAGANGYITKQKAADVLIKAVCSVAAGKRYIVPEIAEQMMGEMLEGQSEVLSHTLLTDREYTVMRRIAKGMSLTAIASELNLSLSTISTYRGRILRKMNLKTNADLTRYAMENLLDIS